MKINYIYQNTDDKNRAECLIKALFEAENININDFKGENTLTVSCDGSSAFYSFDSELSKHGNLGWRLSAKAAGEAFFGRKPDVRIVASKAEQYYNQPSGIHLFENEAFMKNLCLDFESCDILLQATHFQAHA